MFRSILPTTDNNKISDIISVHVLQQLKLALALQRSNFASIPFMSWTNCCSLNFSRVSLRCSSSCLTTCLSVVFNISLRLLRKFLSSFSQLLRANCNFDAFCWISFFRCSNANFSVSNLSTSCRLRFISVSLPSFPHLSISLSKLVSWRSWFNNSST